MIIFIKTKKRANVEKYYDLAKMVCEKTEKSLKVELKIEMRLLQWKPYMFQIEKDKAKFILSVRISLTESIDKLQVAIYNNFCILMP